MNKINKKGFLKHVFIKCALVTKSSKMYTVFLSHALLISLSFNATDTPLNRSSHFGQSADLCGAISIL